MRTLTRLLHKSWFFSSHNGAVSLRKTLTTWNPSKTSWIITENWEHLCQHDLIVCLRKSLPDKDKTISQRNNNSVCFRKSVQINLTWTTVYTPGYVAHCQSLALQNSGKTNWSVIIFSKSYQLPTWHAHLDHVSPVPKLSEDSTSLWGTTHPFFLSKCILKFMTCSYICPKMSTTALTPKHLQKMLYISYILNYRIINICEISYIIYTILYIRI